MACSPSSGRLQDLQVAFMESGDGAPDRRERVSSYVWSATGTYQQTPKNTDFNAELVTILEQRPECGSPRNSRCQEDVADEKVCFASVGKLEATISGLPGLLIGVVINIMLSVPFGLACFPTSWDPFPAPRAIGLQMFLFSTFISQVIMTFLSEFDCALGMMMVENIPFMHSIAQSIVSAQGTGHGALATVMAAFALSTLLIGIAFWLLGRYRAGTFVNYFPRHFITGCIGGIGIFVTQTGFEVSTGGEWDWNQESLQIWSTAAMVKLWLVPVFLVILLNILMRVWRWEFLPPVYFISIIPCFYLVICIFGTPLEEARAQDWLFTRPPTTDFWLIWSLFDWQLIRWDLILNTTPTMLALTCFGLMHPPINVPSLTRSTGVDVDMNQELVVHGYCNILSGMLGGLPNYLCYSNSLLYFKCNGGGRTSGALLSVLLGVAFAMGPSVIAYVPRCMAGCLLIHVGLDLCRECLIDPLSDFDTFEYICVWLITITMTAVGMTQGLVLGLVLSAVSFTLQQMRHSEPVRGIMPATTLRSTSRRTPAEQDELAASLGFVKVVQLQGTIFFGNATDLLSQCEQMLVEDCGQTQIVILDFTLVRSLESSASETIAKIYSKMRKYGVTLVYNRGSTDGFPTSAPLSNQLAQMNSDSKEVGPKLYVADDLDGALAWAEDQLLEAARLKGTLLPQSTPQSFGANHQSLPRQQLHALCENEALNVVDRLFERMTRKDIKVDDVLWKQGGTSDYCLLLSEGLLQSQLEEEAGTTEDCNPGCLVGEYTFLNQDRRMSTLTAKKDSVIYILTRESFEAILKVEPYLGYVLVCISNRYLGHRCRHVANRIWDTRCLTI